MVEKTITDKMLIYRIPRKKANKLIIQYNTRNKKAWFQTDGMLTRKPIEIKRVINLYKKIDPRIYFFFTNDKPHKSWQPYGATTLPTSLLIIRWK